jgi:two-component system nitrate/nitrite response regulator NarL
MLGGEQTAAVFVINRNMIEAEGIRRLLIENSFMVYGVYSDLKSVPSANHYSDYRALFIIDEVDNECTQDMCTGIRSRHNGAMIVMMGEICESHVVAQAISFGVDGYIQKGASCACFVEMIKLVALGEKQAPSQVIMDLVSVESKMRAPKIEALIDDANMTVREIEILRGLVHGDPNKIISRRLNISEATVKVHIKSILRKLHVKNRTQAAIWAASRGVTSDVVRADSSRVRMVGHHR